MTKNGVGAYSSGKESFDGQTLLFTRSQGLFALTIATGAERRLAECVGGFSTFDVAADGLYAACNKASLAPNLGLEGTDSVLHRIDPRTGQDRVLGTLEKLAYNIAVSPDGRTILYTKVVSGGADLMLIENFR